MTDKQRVELIREGNALLNQGNIKEASKIFKQTMYKDGLIRIGDYYFYDKHQPLIAVGYYKLGGAKQKVEEIRERMIFAFKMLIKQDDDPQKTNSPNPPKQNQDESGDVNPINDSKSNESKSNGDEIK